jgi:dolichyl-diphosphooligosaccharide--protein glycosyltransferase
MELFAVIILGFSVRLFSGRNSFTENGILLPGYDEYYHMRRILFTVNHFPNTLWFDSYLKYPEGLNIAWPPLFDQVSAAFCVVFGQHSKSGVEMAASFVPVLIGVIAIAAVYCIVRELFDHNVALLAAFMAALAPDYLLYTSFAATDHHCLEVLFSLIILLFMIKAIICRSEKRFLYALVAGVAMAALAYTWQGAALYLAAFLIYAFIQMTLDLRENHTANETATVLLAAFTAALVLVLPFGKTAWLSMSFQGIAAIMVALAVMHALALIIARNKMDWKAFPLSIPILFVLLAIFTQLSGGLFGTEPKILSILHYFLGGEMIGKISEAEPLIYDSETFSLVMFSALGLTILFSLCAVVASIICIRRSTDAERRGRIMLLLWALFSIIITFGQSRFLYLSSVYMGLMISILFFFLLDWAAKRSPAECHGRSTEYSRFLAALLLLLLVLPMVWDAASFAQSARPDVTGDWVDSLAWLKENSKNTSFFDSPQEKPEYSVMCWWDYGNWVLYLGERPVLANNFQAGALDASWFYLSESEERATSILDGWGCKYVFADYSLIYGKLAALADWASEDVTSYMSGEYDGSQYSIIPRERLFNTTLGKLYLLDGAGMGHLRLIYESKTSIGESSVKSEVKLSEVKLFEYVPGALIRVRSGPDQKVAALVNMTSNQGRPYIYVHEAQAKGDYFEIRVPYSTENRYGCHATSPYLIFSGNKTGLNTTNIQVSEDDVINGKTIDLTL